MTTADDARMLYFVLAGTLLKKILWDSGRFVFHGASLFKDRTVF